MNNKPTSPDHSQDKPGFPESNAQASLSRPNEADMIPTLPWHIEDQPESKAALHTQQAPAFTEQQPTNLSDPVQNVPTKKKRARGIRQRPILRLFSFMLFTLMEYIRSGRILIEILATVAFYSFFLQRDGQNIDAEQFFTLTVMFTLVLTIYTISVVLGIGDRMSSYVLMARRLGRTGYLMGLYLSALVIVVSIYILISVVTLVLSRPPDLSLVSWLMGSLPLLLNVALMGALLLMLSPLVFSMGWRLLVLGIIALALSGNFFSTPMLEPFPQLALNVLDSLQTILGWPLVPVFSGFALALDRDYSGNAPVIIVAQCSLLVAMLSLAIYSFSRREIMFSGE